MTESIGIHTSENPLAELYTLPPDEQQVHLKKLLADGIISLDEMEAINRSLDLGKIMEKTPKLAAHNIHA